MVSSVSAPLPRSAYLRPNTTWTQNGVTVAGGNGEGRGTNQLANPRGILVDDDTLYIADTANHRIVAWKLGETEGQVVAGGNGQGDRIDQLNTPIDVIIDRETDSLLISDYGNRRVVRWPLRAGERGEIIVSNVGCWGLAIDEDGSLYVADFNADEVRQYRRGETQGTVVAGGNGSDDHFDQLYGPKFICIDRDHSLYVSDWNNHRVMKWMENANEGVVVAGDQEEGADLTQLSRPNGIVVDESGSVYVADSGNHRIVRWNLDAREGRVVVGGNDRGNQANQIFDPKGLALDREGHLYVVDNENSRVQRFSIDRS